MTASAESYRSKPPGTLSCFVTTVTCVAAAITFSASGAAPTPLYHDYQEHFGLTPFMITIIFAAYVVSLLVALLTVGSVSDYVGRRPVILTALMINCLAMVVFMTAGSAIQLILARCIQGFANGFAITTLAATILDTDRAHAPLLNSFTAFAGLSAGALGAGALVTFAPAPEQLVYVVLLLLSFMEAVTLWFMPETGTPKPGALASLFPHVRVPPAARATFAAATPVNIASWSLGGFYFSLMPSVVRVATGATLPIIGGLVVATLTVSGASAVVALRNLPPTRMLAVGIVMLTLGVPVTLAGILYQNVAVMLAGTVIGGIGFGTVFSGTLGTILPFAKPDERAALLSAYFVVGYLSFTLPAIAAGFLAPVVGLTRIANFYGAGVILLAVTSLIINFTRHANDHGETA
ncbi:MFS transporter [Mesorhizobium sp. 113-1-2]|uniref:MFS transporter n=1 Tax=Mesorhizobium sp. 113-1-2 TaxID=2744515 RepID=UPI000819981C|nr:MFS transporter [Mesorhizobium sp. 113-1-2]BAV47828.1 Major facilitator superfamily MFS_1 [Mesorhizobium loti]BCG70986.1 MFS transporter [Mesorhizobium sp. 113-1-2]